MTRKTAERIALDQKALDVLDGSDFYFLNEGDIARELDTHPTNVARARALGYVSPALLWALVDADYLDRTEVSEVLTVEVHPCKCGEVHTKKGCTYNRKRRRVRFAADVSPERRDKLRAGARHLGKTNGDYIELLHMFWQQNAPKEWLADAGAEVEPLPAPPESPQ
jgi:hypothetical protein